MLHLNRQLSGMSYRNRNNNLSLNQPSPLAAQQDDAPVAGPSSSSDNTAPSASTSSAAPASPAALAPAPAPVKRKLRPSTSSRDPATPKRSRPAAGGSNPTHAPPTTRLADLGGVDACVEQMLELVALPLMHPEVYLHTGVRPPRGVLLVGPPGCGKTMLAGAIAGVRPPPSPRTLSQELRTDSLCTRSQELGLPFISISAPSVVSGMSGESEKTLRETFEEAARQAPCILFIDEIDAITPKRETAQREMERRIVAQLLTCMDDLAWDKTDGKPVMVISATNRPDSLDPALRRAGRFDAEITMGVPDEAGRERILRVLMGKLRLSGDFDYALLAKGTPGYVGADLSALTGAAGVIAVKRIFEQFGPDGAAALLPELATGEGALGLLQASSGGGEDAEMAGVEAVQQDGEASSALLDDSSALSSAAPTPGTVTPSEDAPPPSAAAADGTLAAVPSLPFSTLPPSLAALPIASFLRTHPTSLTPDQLSSIALTNADFVRALTIVQPSSQREGFTTVPDVTWDDLGALTAVRDEMRMSIVRPIRRPDVFALLGLNAPCGVLLWGPPGCGKTLLAKAVANESRANFISVKGPELLNKVRTSLAALLLQQTLDPDEDSPARSTSASPSGPCARSSLAPVRRARASSSSTSSTPWSLAATTASCVPLSRSSLLFSFSRSTSLTPALPPLAVRVVRPHRQHAPHRARRPRAAQAGLRHRRDEPARHPRPGHVPPGPPRQAPVRRPALARRPRRARARGCDERRQGALCRARPRPRWPGARLVDRRRPARRGRDAGAARGARRDAALRGGARARQPERVEAAAQALRNAAEEVCRAAGRAPRRGGRGGGSRCSRGARGRLDDGAGA